MGLVASLDGCRRSRPHRISNPTKATPQLVAIMPDLFRLPSFRYSRVLFIFQFRSVFTVTTFCTHFFAAASQIVVTAVIRPPRTSVCKTAVVYLLPSS